ncbi:MAG TPA: hypothetical protein VFI29_07110 [Hanamia sp.]|nr:hypothetical protein [Hanamia sp.]
MSRILHPFQKKQELIKFYNQQIENNETSFLLDLIERYHKNDIIEYISKSKNFISNSTLPWQSSHTTISNKQKLIIWKNKTIRFVFPLSWQNRKSYAISVLHGILNNPAFIPQSSNLRPYLFADIISAFTKLKRRSFPDNLCNAFLSEIINHKSFWLKKELKQSESFDSGQPDYFFDENKILGALLKDLSVAEVNQVWQPFGNIAVDEIEEERENGFQSKLFQEFREEQFLWDYKSFIAIKFFKVLIAEVITRKYKGSHFWLYYYRRITEAILKTFDKYHPTDVDTTTTNYHQFIEIMIDNLFLWLDISNETEDDGFYHSVVDCIGILTHSICKSQYFGEKRQKNCVERILTTYCNLQDNPQTENIRTQLGIKLLKPSMLTNNGDNYYHILEEAWIRFDKIPHRHGNVDLQYFTKLKDTVIIPSGLDPDQY